MRCPTLAQLPLPASDRTGWPWTGESSGLPALATDGGDWPLLSIVTPSYNQAQFLEETIRSVLLQAYPNLEYIIIDGGSTDGSVDIIRKYEPWLAQWVSEPDRGQSHAINKGWSRSRGAIVAWLNSDDVYAPGAFGGVARAFSQHSAGLAYGDYNVIDERSRTTKVVNLGPFDLRAQFRRNLIPQPATFLRRQVLDAVGLLDEDLHFVMDYELWLRVAERFPVHHQPQVWASFRVCTGTKSFSNPEAFVEETMAILRRHLADEGIARAVGASLGELRSRVLQNAGLACCDFGQFPEARRYLLRAMRSYPAIALRTPILVQTLRSLLQS